MNTWQKSIEERVELFKAFHGRKNNRPLFGFFKGSEFPLFRYSFSRTLPEDRSLRPHDFDVSAFVADTEQLFLDHEACGGDFIYSASAFWGIPWLEAALGCPLHANHSTGSIYCEPPPGFTAADLPAFSRDNPWMRLMVAMHQHSTGFVPTDKYLDMGMSVLELHIDSGGPSAQALYDRHLAILKQRPLLIWDDIQDADLDWLFNNLPPQGLAIITVVDSAELACALWELYVSNT